MSSQVRLTALVRDRSGAGQVKEVEMSPPQKTQVKVALTCTIPGFHAALFRHVTTSVIFSLCSPHDAFPTYPHLQSPSAILIPSHSQLKTDRGVEEMSNFGKQRMCWLGKVLNAGYDMLLFPLSSLWNNHFLSELQDFCCWPCGSSSSFAFLNNCGAWPCKAQSPN